MTSLHSKMPSSYLKYVLIVPFTAIEDSQLSVYTFSWLFLRVALLMLLLLLFLLTFLFFAWSRKNDTVTRFVYIISKTSRKEYNYFLIKLLILFVIYFCFPCALVIFLPARNINVIKRRCYFVHGHDINIRNTLFNSSTHQQFCDFRVIHCLFLIFCNILAHKKWCVKIFDVHLTFCHF